MNQVVMVHFFGKFCLESKNGRLDEETIHSKKIIKLLAFLLLNHNRMINVEELGELVWGNGGSSNPMGALKNLIYRLRNTLKQLGPEEYIVSRSGTYGKNSDIAQNKPGRPGMIQNFKLRNTKRHYPAMRNPAPVF